MKTQILFLLIACSYFPLFSQNNSRVTIEDVVNPAYESDMKKVRSIQDQISIASKKIGTMQSNPYNNRSKKNIKEWISNNLKVKEQLNSSTIDQKCKAALLINRKWNRTFYTDKRFPCNSIANKLKRVNEFIQLAKNELNGKVTKEKKEKSHKLIDQLNIKNYKKEIAELDKESRKLDDLLNKKGKSKSIEDFLNSKGNKSKRIAAKNNKSKSLKLLTTTKTKSKSLSKKINKTLTKQNKGTTFKIVNRVNDVSGVVDGQGKTIIPFRNWSISEYKYGIAKVSIPFDSFKCSAFDAYKWSQEYATKAVAYKVGFVDQSGDFIDGFEVKATGGGVYRGIWLTLTTKYKTIEQKERAERAAKIRKQKKAAARKRCSIEVKRWKLSVTSRY